MASPSKLSPPDAAARGGALPLPADALYEILLLLPAKDLCRLRAVCRPWRALLSDPRFVAAHAARHPAPLPLVVLGYHHGRYHVDYPNDGIACDLMDHSGRVVKRVRRADVQWAVSVQLDLVCVARGARERYGLLDPATGDVRALPQGFAKEHAAHKLSITGYLAAIVFGKVASTGEIKVLRLLDNSDDSDPVQLCEIVTLGNGGNHGQWRGKEAPPELLVLDDPYRSVVIDGIAYFSSYRLECIASFDLETEEWRQPLRGPLSSLLDADPQAYDSNLRSTEFSMVALSGHLVVAYPTRASTDLWFLMDFEKGLWVKQHSIPNSVLPAGYGRYIVCPLLVLEDGSIMLLYSTGFKGLIRIYSPGTNSFTHLAEVGNCPAVGLYTGSLMSLATNGN
ncbi:hypothetical protein ACP4OV_019496 [Aristida adscensionis]